MKNSIVALLAGVLILALLLSTQRVEAACPNQWADSTTYPDCEYCPGMPGDVCAVGTCGTTCGRCGTWCQAHCTNEDLACGESCTTDVCGGCNNEVTCEKTCPPPPPPKGESRCELLKAEIIMKDGTILRDFQDNPDRFFTYEEAKNINHFHLNLDIDQNDGNYNDDDATSDGCWIAKRENPEGFFYDNFNNWPNGDDIDWDFPGEAGDYILGWGWAKGEGHDSDDCRAGRVPVTEQGRCRLDFKVMPPTQPPTQELSCVKADIHHDFGIMVPPPGEIYQAIVSIKNTGDSDWSASSNDRFELRQLPVAHNFFWRDANTQGIIGSVIASDTQEARALFREDASVAVGGVEEGMFNIELPQELDRSKDYVFKAQVYDTEENRFVGAICEDSLPVRERNRCGDGIIQAPNDQGQYELCDILPDGRSDDTVWPPEKENFENGVNTVCPGRCGREPFASTSGVQPPSCSCPEEVCDGYGFPDIDPTSENIYLRGDNDGDCIFYYDKTNGKWGHDDNGDKIPCNCITKTDEMGKTYVDCDTGVDEGYVYVPSERTNQPVSAVLYDAEGIIDDDVLDDITACEDDTKFSEIDIDATPAYINITWEDILDDGAITREIAIKEGIPLTLDYETPGSMIDVEWWDPGTPGWLPICKGLGSDTEEREEAVCLIKDKDDANKPLTFILDNDYLKIRLGFFAALSEEPEKAYFKFQQPPNKETFIFKLVEPEKIAKARAILAGEETTKVHVMGNIMKKYESYNQPWSFIMKPTTIDFFSEAIEEGVLVCDGFMLSIEENFDAFCSSFPEGACSWCPYSSVLVEEIHPSAVHAPPPKTPISPPIPIKPKPGPILT